MSEDTTEESDGAEARPSEGMSEIGGGVDAAPFGFGGRSAKATGAAPTDGSGGAAEPERPARPRVVVLGWGNASRGDDGLGPALVERVEALGLDHVTAHEDFQLQLEHALDLTGADIALFADASMVAPDPFSFEEIGPREGLTHTSHAMAPEAVLDVYARVIERTPPPSFVLGIRGEEFALGTDMSEAALGRLEAAWSFLRPLLEEPDVAAWRAATIGRHATND